MLTLEIMLASLISNLGDLKCLPVGKVEKDNLLDIVEENLFFFYDNLEIVTTNIIILTCYKLILKNGWYLACASLQVGGLNVRSSFRFFLVYVIIVR